MRAKYQKFVRCDTDVSKAVCVSVYPDWILEEINLEQWSMEVDSDGLWSRLKKAWQLIFNKSYHSHDIVYLKPESVDELVSGLLEAANMVRAARPLTMDDLEERYKEVIEEAKPTN